MKDFHLVSLFFIGLLLFVTYQLLRILSPFFTPLFWGAILAFAFHPISARLKAHMRHDAFAAIIMTGVVLLVLVPILFLLLANLVNETQKLYDWISVSIQNGRFEHWGQTFMSMPLFDWIQANMDWNLYVAKFKDWAANSATALLGFATESAAVITKNIFQFVIKLLFVLLFLFVFFKDGEKIYRFIFDLTPLEKENKQEIFEQINATFGAVIHGQLLSALIQSVLAAIIFGAMALPFPLLLAFLVFFCAIVPMMGAPLVWIPLVIYLFIQHHYLQALILFALGAIVIGSVDNIVHPLLIGKRTKLPYVLLLLGIIGGLVEFGVLGLFIGPTLLSLFFVLTRMFRKKFEAAEPPANPA